MKTLHHQTVLLRASAIHQQLGDAQFTNSLPIHLAMSRRDLLQEAPPMAAIGRFQKGDDIFYAKVVDGELYRLQGDVFGSPSFEKKPMRVKGLKTLTPVVPSKLIAIGLNYSDHARESGKPLPKQPLFWLKATAS